MTWHTIVVGLLLAGACGQPSAAEAADQWLTGRELEARLAEPISVQWTAVPFKQAIGNLARAHSIGLFLDRRVDPSFPVTLSAESKPIGEVCQALAASAGVAFCRLDTLGYFGPAETCRRLPTIAAMRHDELARLPAPARLDWSRPAAWSWRELSAPRELAEQLAHMANAAIESAGKIPHDLWAAGELPPLSVLDRLTVITAGFDLTFQLSDDGRHVRLLDWPERPAVERSYHGGSRARELASRWAALAPHSRLTVEGTKVIVRGPVEDQQRIADSRQTSTRAAAAAKPPATEVYTLKLEAVPLSALLQVLERKLKLHVELDQAAIAHAKIDLEQLVSLNVERATLDQLLQAALKPAGLAFERNGNNVRIGPLKP